MFINFKYTLIFVSFIVSYVNTTKSYLTLKNYLKTTKTSVPIIDKRKDAGLHYRLRIIRDLINNN